MAGCYGRDNIRSSGGLFMNMIIQVPVAGSYEHDSVGFSGGLLWT